MKKLLLLSLIFLVLLSTFTGCSPDVAVPPANPPSENNLEQEMDDANEAYYTLYYAFNTSSAISNAIYSAWGYAIYYAEDDVASVTSSFSRSEWDDQMLGLFWLRTEEMAITEQLRTAIEDVLGTSDGGFWQHALQNSSYTVAIAQKYCELSSYYADVEKYLEEGAEYIGNLSEENKSSTHKEDLVELYSVISTFYNTVKEPSGSYYSFGTSITNYKNDIDAKITSLSIYIA